MPETPWERVEELFAEAVALPPALQGAFVERAAGADEVLRRELLSLLAAHQAQDSFLDQAQPDRSLSALPPRPRAELVGGTRLGPWQLDVLIGRGGAGEVYTAHRADGAFEQRVAIKVLRREAVRQLERFHAERRILARLEHPGIARLIDGGVDPEGRPYAVLEFVLGTTILEHCRAHDLDLEARLALLGQVVEAVAYAHRHLVIHRDLKPGNILVGVDGRVKLLDFGIAKLLEPGAPGASAEVTQAPLTLDYAAPEQLTGDAVTTATDVYALGVVLFELLTGVRPWRSAELPVARAMRLLLDEAPPAPSTVARLSAVPARRLVGDLDAIVAMSLRKEPAARYPTVEALWLDLERHRHRQPVEAREGARLYLLGRFVSRHRWPVAMAAALFFSLALGLAGFAWQARRTGIERDAARHAASREQAVRDQLIGLFRGSLSESARTSGAEPITAKSMLDRSAVRVIEGYKDDPLLAGQVVETLADLYGALGDVAGQAPLLEGFLAAASSNAGGPEADPRAVALARQKLAHLELFRGNPGRAGELLALAEGFWQAAGKRYREERLEGLFVRGQLERARGDLEGSIATYRRAIEERTALSGRVHRETANLVNSLAISLTAAQRIDEALAAHREALAILDELGRGEDLEALVMLANTGALALRSGHVREAEEILGKAFRRQRAAGGDSAAVAAAMGLYGIAASQRGEPGAPAVLAEALVIAERFTGPASPLAVQNRLFRAEALAVAGDLEAARQSLEQNLGICRRQFGEEHVLTLRMRLALARLALLSAQPEAAIQEARALLVALAPLKGPSAAFQADARLLLGEALLRLGRPLEAVAPLREAVSRREQLLWSGGWELAQARARLGEALLAASLPGGLELLERALPALSAELGADHPETRRARQVLHTGTTTH